MDLATGQNLIKQKKFPQALKLFDDLMKLDPNNRDIYFYLGRIYSELQNFRKSIKFYNKFLETNKNSIACILNLAILYLNIGDIKNSSKNFKKLLKIDKDYIYAYYGLFSLSKDLIEEKDYNHLKTLLNSQKTNLRDKSLINFIFSKRERNKNNIKKELSFLSEYHEQSFRSNFSYNSQSQFYYEKVLGKFEKKISFLNSSENYLNVKPIFIIGLPRSGSTLIESLITSGTKRVKTYGESNFFNIAIFDQIKNIIFNKEFDTNKVKFEIDLKLIKKEISDRYDLKSLQDDKILFLDKSLENIFNINIILKIFPNAKFIHTKRNLNDAILSIYFSMLPELSWTLSLKTIKAYVRNYQHTITYYKNKLPEKIFEIDLEKLTSDPVKISKDIFKFCNLDWSRGALNFYQRKDLFSKTLSSSQIRKEISKSNQSKYDKYYFLLENN